MNRLNQLKLLTIAAAITMITATASATVIDDTYMGSDDHGWGDRIGNHATSGGGYTFEVHNMDASITGTTLNVTINTNYAGHTGTYGTGYGDLFISSSWTPFGNAPYSEDDHDSGTNWTYGLSLDGDTYSTSGLDKSSSTRFTSNAGGTVSLYELNGSNNDDAFLAEDMTSSTFRNGQEVVIDKRSQTSVDTSVDGTWSISSLDSDDYISFSINLAGTTLLDGSEIALHWGMTCGNDTIEGAFSVPEPGALPILATGLLAVGIATTRRKKSL